MVSFSKNLPIEYKERVSHKDKTSAVYLECLKAYEFAQPFAQKSIVLDAACGTGIGAPLLAEGAVSVVGIDCSWDALKECQEAVVLNNARFCQGDVTHLPFAAATFDLVVSLETIEHVEEDELLVSEVHRVLKSGGQAIFSTPNQPITSPSGIVKNPHHVREYSRAECEELLKKHFQEIEWWGQMRGPKIWEALEGTPAKRLLAKLDPWNLRNLIPTRLYRLLNRWAGFAQQESLGLQDFEIVRDSTDKARVLIAVATKS